MGPRRVRPVAQDAEAGARDRAQHALAADGGRLVLAVTQERERAGGQPPEELRELVLDRARTVELLGQRGRSIEHGRPVGDRRGHVCDDAQEIGPELVQYRGIGLAVDLDVLERLDEHVVVRRLLAVGLPDPDQFAPAAAPHRQHGVGDDVQPQAVPAQLRGQRVDQERHVVGDHLHDRVRAGEAVLLVVG